MHEVIPKNNPKNVRMFGVMLCGIKEARNISGFFVNSLKNESNISELNLILFKLTQKTF